MSAPLRHALRGTFTLQHGKGRSAVVGRTRPNIYSERNSGAQVIGYDTMVLTSTADCFESAGRDWLERDKEGIVLCFVVTLRDNILRGAFVEVMIIYVPSKNVSAYDYKYTMYGPDSRAEFNSISTRIGKSRETTSSQRIIVDGQRG